MEIRYYNRHEWEKLSREEQKEVRDHRQHELKRKKSSTDGGASKIAALETMVEQQGQSIAALRACKDEALTLPPKPKESPLRPPIGFTQRK